MYGFIKHFSGGVKYNNQFYLYPLMVFKDEIGVPLKLNLKQIDNNNETDIEVNEYI